MHVLVSFFLVFIFIISYLFIYHQVETKNVLEVMHSSFTRQFIFELIPFIILFSVREIKFIDISSASEFFNSVVGRSIIGMIAFTFVSFSLISTTPNPINTAVKQIDTIIDSTNLMKLNSFTPKMDSNKNENINAFEKYITYASI